jgi:F-type H+-transporting ATPase subunit delta
MATVTNTYARAFADVVFADHLDPATILAEAESLAALVAGSRDLREVWHTPSIPAEQKRAVLDAIAARQPISRPVRNFMAVLIDHHRVDFLGAIVKQFGQELNQRLGFTEAAITSARALSEPERQSLEAVVEKLTGRKVLARYSEDATILGGAMVRIGSTIYDGSVKGTLERMREQLSSS